MLALELADVIMCFDQFYMIWLELRTLNKEPVYCLEVQFYTKYTSIFTYAIAVLYGNTKTDILNKKL